MHLYRQCTLPCCISLPDCAIFPCHPPWQSTNHRCTYTPDLSVRETQGCSCGEEAKTNHSRVRTMVGTNNHSMWWSYQQLNHVITPRYHRLPPPSDPWTGWFLYFSPRLPKLTYWLKTLPCRFCAVTPQCQGSENIRQQEQKGWNNICARNSSMEKWKPWRAKQSIFPSWAFLCCFFIHFYRPLTLT